MKVLVLAALAGLLASQVALADLLPPNLKTATLKVKSVSSTGGALTIAGDAEQVKLAGGADDAKLIDHCLKFALVAKASGAKLTIGHIPAEFGNFGSKPYSCTVE